MISNNGYGRCWRQGNHTLTVPETTAIEFSVDGLPPVSIDDVAAICTETMELVELVSRFCGGEARYGVLTKQCRSYQL